MEALQKVIYKNMLLSSLIPIVIIEVALLVLYFGINLYTSNQNESTLSEEVLGNLQHITAREAQSIDHQLEEVSRLSSIMQHDHQRFFSNLGNCTRQAQSPEYIEHNNGAFFSPINNGGSSVYYASTTEMTSQARRKAICSESIDPLMIDIVRTNPIVTQAYLNTWDDMNRWYPFMDNAAEQYGSAINMEDYNFYYLADGTHNPSRKDVWTSAYLDPAGQGWMVSNIVPIYQDDFLEGVSGLDVTIERFVSKVLNLDLPWHASAFLMDESGKVLVMQPQAENILGLQELTDHNYTSNVKETVEKPEQFNLLHSKDIELAKLFSQLIESSDSVLKVQIKNQDFFISIDTIDQTGWRLVTMVDESIILQPVHRLHELGKRIGWAAVILMVLFYILFFIFLKRKSQRLSKLIATPIETLSVMTQDLKAVMSSDRMSKTGIVEIDRLTSNFQKMGHELDTSSKALVEAEVQQRVVEKEKEFLQQLATTDQLTQLSNRHHLTSIFKQEIERTKRYGHSFSVILVDVDHFKQVNDSYGHDVGDQVLQMIANIFDDNIRSTDVASRWGGEEFLIVCAESTGAEVLEIAEELRKYVSEHKFDTVGHITASFGIAEYIETDDMTSLIGRADQALYKAKRSGRNQCILAS